MHLVVIEGSRQKLLPIKTEILIKKILRIDATKSARGS